ncbi:hypothetical protein chiPu_0022637 [Chiloscyllium punctatum]|uniref:Vacuolar protein sorting-associated protein 51 homolog n=1 Tax=Chiloscyllium punctatum TaxID=137246 RepID=A0A401RI73_CHIPU|nr:hypothetical protein [Chiloscyllium punctatum]
MVKHIRALDSDMQTLVYENYNKFISATGYRRGTWSRNAGPAEDHGAETRGLQRITEQKRGAGRGTRSRNAGPAGEHGAETRGPQRNTEQKRGGPQRNTEQKRGGPQWNTEQKRGGPQWNTEQKRGGPQWNTEQKRGGPQGNTEQKRGGPQGNTGQKRGGPQGNTGQKRGGPQGNTGQKRGGAPIWQMEHNAPACPATNPTALSFPDTIRKMKNDFKKMEDEMDCLATNMAAITEFSARISHTLQDQHQQITKLSGAPLSYI